MITLSALLALCEGNVPLIGGSALQRASNADHSFIYLIFLPKQVFEQKKQLLGIFYAMKLLSIGSCKKDIASTLELHLSCTNPLI